MPVETPSLFARVIQDHLELKRRNAELEPAMPLDGYRIDDPFNNHPLFKTEEQARLEETMDGDEPAVSLDSVPLTWPGEESVEHVAAGGQSSEGHRPLVEVTRLRLGRLTFAQPRPRRRGASPRPVDGRGAGTGRPGRISSRSVPRWTIRPCSSTRISSARRTVASRWAMMIDVLPARSRSNAFSITISVGRSMFDVASSRIRIRGSARSARARGAAARPARRRPATRCARLPSRSTSTARRRPRRGWPTPARRSLAPNRCDMRHVRSAAIRTSARLPSPSTRSASTAPARPTPAGLGRRPASAGCRAYRLQQPGHQRQRHHRRLVHHDDVVGQPVLAMVPKPRRVLRRRRSSRCSVEDVSSGSRPGLRVELVELQITASSSLAAALPVGAASAIRSGGCPASGLLGQQREQPRHRGGLTGTRPAGQHRKRLRERDFRGATLLLQPAGTAAPGWAGCWRAARGEQRTDA